jgi:hypothetical protein
LTPQRLHAELRLIGGTLQKQLIAYLYGAAGDATYSKLHNTWRFSQNDQRWLLKLKSLLKQIGYKSWLYREGRKRRVYVLETSARFLSDKARLTSMLTEAEKVAFVRGFFDAEGGVPQSFKSRFYVQFSQKNLEVLQYVRNFLQELGIQCGRMHNPSAKVDPEYWRFFIRAQSYKDFIETIGSWHPRKIKILLRRMKI